MNEQISVLDIYDGEDIAELEKQAELFAQYNKEKHLGRLFEEH